MTRSSRSSARAAAAAVVRRRRTRARPGPKVVALGGGHGLAASLSALRHVTDQLTAVVTVADDGGSSGRLRRELGVLPPGDLRMALAALCGDDDWGRTWSDVLQHRFSSDGDLSGHSVGNLLIVALWERLRTRSTASTGSAGCSGAQGRVLPMTAVPLEIEAQVLGADPERAARAVDGARAGRGGDHAGPGRRRLAWCPRTRRPAPRRSWRSRRPTGSSSVRARGSPP